VELQRRRVLDREPGSVAEDSTRSQGWRLSPCALVTAAPGANSSITTAYYRAPVRSSNSDREEEGEVVTCPWHGLEFHVPTGQCLALPDTRLRTYELRTVDGEIRVVV
jgi:hypothetical protein